MGCPREEIRRSHSLDADERQYRASLAAPIGPVLCDYLAQDGHHADFPKWADPVTLGSWAWT